MKNNLTLVVTVLALVLFSSCDAGDDQKQTISEKPSSDEPQTNNPASDNQVKEPDNSNTLQSGFVSQKIETFKEQINSDATATEIEQQQRSLTSKFLKEQNNQLTDWTGEIISVDMFQDTELDIAITILGREIVGQKMINGRTMDCGITIETDQGTSKKYGFKGIARSGELYEKAKKLQEGDKVIFSAKVVDAWDNTEKTGLNLSTLLHIQLTDIRPQ